ncbi:lysylphosphatidylglycerol synthase domain-containing protein [uncultured Ruegeria sp.]|uniref:lysylphosphatidylglycerol synthase domain-containing protein n=1 Tax=uncultured Ruegeria sp. TaxID=259304 RepID=UPI00260F908E|nr:lysylphosphatidylglycerol synthase domain-containing protein [uncultured Ruegeria sp.]
MRARHVLPTQVALGFLVSLCNISAFAACAMTVGVSLPILAVLVLVPLILFSMLVPLTISGWGVRESAAAALLPTAGPSVLESIAVSVLFGIAIILTSFPG